MALHLLIISMEFPASGSPRRPRTFSLFSPGLMKVESLGSEEEEEEEGHRRALGVTLGVARERKV